MTTAYDEAPTMNGHEPNGHTPTPEPDRKRALRRMRELLEHTELGPQLADEIRAHHMDLVDQEEKSIGLAKRKLGNSRHLVGLLLTALDEFHGIEAE